MKTASHDYKVGEIVYYGARLFRVGWVDETHVGLQCAGSYGDGMHMTQAYNNSNIPVMAYYSYNRHAVKKTSWQLRKVPKS